jgi:DNA-binding XRE family transcriptional regulator
MRSKDISAHRETLEQIRGVRQRAIEHARLARELSAQRRQLLESLVEAGVSQADIARELGVSRQAIQKMLTA